VFYYAALAPACHDHHGQIEWVLTGAIRRRQQALDDKELKHGPAACARKVCRLLIRLVYEPVSSVRAKQITESLALSDADGCS
jgi:hypothetical protein